METPLDSQTLAERLFREHGVAVIPDNAFGLDEGYYLRIAYGALELVTARAGMRRLTAGLEELVRHK